jgi:hypothetical protein
MGAWCTRIRAGKRIGTQKDVRSSHSPLIGVSPSAFLPPSSRRSACKMATKSPSRPPIGRISASPATRAATKRWRCCARSAGPCRRVSTSTATRPTRAAHEQPNLPGHQRAALRQPAARPALRSCARPARPARRDQRPGAERVRQRGAAETAPDPAGNHHRLIAIHVLCPPPLPLTLAISRDRRAHRLPALRRADRRRGAGGRLHHSVLRRPP